MAKVILNDIANFNQTGIGLINQNSEQIEEAMEKTLSRDGTSPNQMEADLDMNHNDVLNVKLLQVEDLVVGGQGETGLLEQIEQAVEDAQEAAGISIEASLDAIDAAESAADYAALARNDFAVDRFAGDGLETVFTLDADPGSGNNCLVYIDGVYQQKDTYSLVGTTLTFSEAPPGNGLFQNIEVAYGYQVTLGTPADGTVTEDKIANSAVTEAKLDDDSVSTLKIQDEAVTKAKLDDDSVDETKLDSSKVTEMLALLTGKTGGFSSGTYTPTATIVSNLDSITPSICTWTRVLDIVFVTGLVTLDPTAAGANTDFRLSLPIPSSFGAQTDGGGAGVSLASGSADGMTGLAITASAANHEFFCRIFASTTSSYSFSFIAMYRIV